MRFDCILLVLNSVQLFFVLSDFGNPCRKSWDYAARACIVTYARRRSPGHGKISHALYVSTVFPISTTSFSEGLPRIPGLPKVFRTCGLYKIFGRGNKFTRSTHYYEACARKMNAYNRYRWSVVWISKN